MVRHTTATAPAVIPLEDRLPPDDLLGKVHLITWRAGRGTTSHSSSRSRLSRSLFARGSGLGHTALYIEAVGGYPGMYISYTMGEGGHVRGFCDVARDFEVMADQSYAVHTLDRMRIRPMLQQALLDAAQAYAARTHNCSTVAQNILRAGASTDEARIPLPPWHFVCTPEGLLTRTTAATGVVPTEDREARKALKSLINDRAERIVLPERNNEGIFKFAYVTTDTPDPRPPITYLNELVEVPIGPDRSGATGTGLSTVTSVAHPIGSDGSGAGTGLIAVTSTAHPTVPVPVTPRVGFSPSMMLSGDDAAKPAPKEGMGGADKGTDSPAI